MNARRTRFLECSIVMFRTLSFVLCLVAATHQFNITKFSVPKAVEAGGEAELLCEHDADDAVSITKWFWKPVAGKSQQLYQYAEGSNPPQIIIPRGEPPLNITLKVEGGHSLILWDMQPGHSGTFECEVEEEKGDFQERRDSSDLVVYTIGDGPQLTIEGEDDVQITCEAAGVAPVPEISLTYDSNTFNTTLKVDESDGLYNITSNATVSRQHIEGAEISCKLSFKDTDIVPTELMEVSSTYHSDAWLATTTAAPDEPVTQGTQEQTMPDSAGRAAAAGTIVAAIAIPLLRALL